MITALTAAAAVLLVAAGLGKLRRPATAVLMLRTVAPPHTGPRLLRVLVRGASVAEIGVGGWVLAGGGRAAGALLGSCYLALALVAARLASRAPGTACGCFGSGSAPVGVAHVVLDAVCLGVCIAGVLAPGRSLAALIRTSGASGPGIALGVLLLAALGYLTVTALPDLATSRRLVERTR